MAKQKKLIDELKRLVKNNEENKKSKSLSIRMTEEQYEAIEIVSKATGKSKSDIIIEALEKEGLFDEEAIEFFKSLIQGEDNERDESDRENTSATENGTYTGSY